MMNPLATYHIRANTQKTQILPSWRFHVNVIDGQCNFPKNSQMFQNASHQLLLKNSAKFNETAYSPEAVFQTSPNATVMQAAISIWNYVYRRIRQNLNVNLEPGPVCYRLGQVQLYNSFCIDFVGKHRLKLKRPRSRRTRFRTFENGPLGRRPVRQYSSGFIGKVHGACMAKSPKISENGSRAI